MTASTDDATKGRRLLAAVVLAGGLAGLAGVYGIGGMLSKSADASCGAAVKTAGRLAPLSRGEVAAVAIATDPQRLPDLTFQIGRAHV